MPEEDSSIKLTSTQLSYKGKNKKGTTYAVDIDFFAEINVEESKRYHSSKETGFILRKKENKEEYWPRLTKEKARLHWLKTDFDKVGVLPLCSPSLH